MTKPNATPGGSLMPAMDYRSGQRGTGAGQAIPGTGKIGWAMVDNVAPIRPGKVKRVADSVLYGDGLLGESLAPSTKGNLADRFMIPPFTVLSAREGAWQDRKRTWLALGIQSELGRGEDITWNVSDVDEYRHKEGTRPTQQAQLDTIIAADPAVPASYQPPAQAKQTRASVAPRSASPSYRPALPESFWMPPAELPSLKGVKRLGFDTETRDEQLRELGPGFRRGAYMVGMSLATDDGRRLYLPTRHEGGGNLDPDLVERWAREELNNFDGELVGARLGYDLEAVAQFGVTFPKVTAFHDIQVLEPLIDEWRFKYGLDDLAKDYLGADQGKDETLLRQACAAYGWNTDDEVKANLWRLPASYAGTYAEADADRPLRILPLQLEKIEADGLQRVYEVERKLVPLLVQMRMRGVRVDMEAAPRVRDELVAERDTLLAKLKHFAGPGAEFMAPDSFIKAINERGLKYSLTDKTKAPSITKKWLKANSYDPMIATILEGRSINTVVNTFMDGHILSHAINGRIHCTFPQLKNDDSGTAARFSSENPNLQNLPARDGRLGPIVRKLFLPEEGQLWQMDDYSQIEYRLLAHFAVGNGAEECRQAYINDPTTDYHKLCAKFCGIDPEDKLARGRVKGVNFAKGYGAGPDQMASLLECTLREAIDFIKMYETALPFTKETYNTAMKWAKKQGFVSTLLGRKHRFPFYEPSNNYGKNKKPGLPYDMAIEKYGRDIVRANTYKGLNNKLQGSAADIMKKAMVDADEAGIFDVIGVPHVTVHDELGDSIPQTLEGLEAGRELTQIMADTIKLRVPVIVSSSQGASWGDCKE